MAAATGALVNTAAAGAALTQAATPVAVHATQTALVFIALWVATMAAATVTSGPVLSRVGFALAGAAPALSIPALLAYAADRPAPTAWVSAALTCAVAGLLVLAAACALSLARAWRRRGPQHPH